MLRPKSKSLTVYKGFTIIELLVVIAIMVMMATVLIISYNRNSGTRNLRIAQSKLVTDIRKAQSFILSARNNTDGTANKFYMVRLGKDTTGTPPVNTIYRLQRINNSYVAINEELLNLPQGITINDVQVKRAGGSFAAATCAQIIFAAPYGKVYIYTRPDNNCSPALLAAVVQDPSQLLPLADSTLVITLQDSRTLATKTVTITGVSGNVLAN